MLSAFFFSALVAALLWATLRGKDAWPFSHYPMFSAPATLSGLIVVRIALETRAGAIIWWRSRFFRYPEYIGRRLKATYDVEEAGHRHTAVTIVERQWFLTEALRLIRLEEGSLDRYAALRIVRRTASNDPAGGLMIEERMLARIPLNDLERTPRVD